LADILAEVREGTRRDALLHSLSANAEHGHRRTNDDKRRAVDIMLNDPEWVCWNDVEIARRCGVSSNFVGDRRRIIHPINDGSRRVTRNGTTYEMNTGNIGARPAATPTWICAACDAEVDADLIWCPTCDRGEDGRPRPNGDATERHSDHDAMATFDWDAARLRREAMEPIRALARQSPPRLSE
jgi:hypothetical protein